MSRRKLFRSSAVVSAAVVVAGSTAPSRAGTPAAGNLFFDTFRIQNPFTAHVYADATVDEVRFTYDGASTFTLGTPTVIKDLGPSGNADGLIFGPGGNLLVGGSTTAQILQLTPAGTVVGAVNVTGTNPYHMTMSLDAKTIYSGGQTTLQGGDSPGPLGVTPFFSTGAGHALTGDDTGITQLAFDPAGHAYYTSSPYTGTGNFGTINVSTFTTTRKIAGLAAAHGITYDPFTGDLMVAGAGQIAQIDPTTLAVVSSVDLTSLGVTLLDQIYVDGRGHLFAASNGNVNLFTGVTSKAGQLVMIDYSAGTHQVGAAGNFIAAPTLANALDDIAQLASLQPGDANFDGTANYQDLLILAHHFGQAGGYNDGDFNGDGVVNFADLMILARNFGRSLTGSPAAGPSALSPAFDAPEPSSTGLLFAAAPLLLRRGRRHGAFRHSLPS